MSVSKRSVEDAPLNGFHRKLTVYSAGGPFLDGYVLSIIGVACCKLPMPCSCRPCGKG